MPGKHMDIELDYTPTTAQKSFFASLGTNPMFSDNCIYVNGSYVGGRPNDR